MGVHISKSGHDKNTSKITLRKGYYYSKQRTNELLKTSDQSEGEVWVIPVMLLDYPVLLDYPEVKGSKGIFYQRRLYDKLNCLTT